MKSFFALATAVALVFAPCATANPVPPGAPAHFFTNLGDNLAFGVPNRHPGPGAPLVLANGGNGSPDDVTLFALTAGTDRGAGHIRLIGGFPDQPLCVSGGQPGGPPNRPAIVDRCNPGDPTQRWFVQGGGPTTISNRDGECVTVRSDSPSVGDHVTIEPCEDSDGPEQLWDVVGA